MGTYFDAVRELKGREGRKVANNTYLERDPFDGSIGLRLHSTVVVRWSPDGSITLRSGGWHTATTKDRIDRWLPSGLRLATDRDGAWAVYRLRARFDDAGELAGYAWDGRRYFDGMTINEDGEVLNPHARDPRGAAFTSSGW